MTDALKELELYAPRSLPFPLPSCTRTFAISLQAHRKDTVIHRFKFDVKSIIRTIHRQKTLQRKGRPSWARTIPAVEDCCLVRTSTAPSESQATDLEWCRHGPHHNNDSRRCLYKSVKLHISNACDMWARCRDAQISLFRIHILSVSVTNYPYPHDHRKRYPYPIRIRLPIFTRATLC